MTTRPTPDPDRTPPPSIAAAAVRPIVFHPWDTQYRLPFAFYGRVSTEDNQDPQSSYDWQHTRAAALIITQGGGLVAEYFDVGDTRALPWQRRPEATALLEALRNPDRGFNDVVIGEPHRAFYGNQFGLTLPLFTHYGVRMWVPEVGGAIDPDNEAHDLVMAVFGGYEQGRDEPGSRSGSAPPWPPRPTWKAATSAAGHRTDTPWRTWARTPTRARPQTANTCTA